MLVNYSKSRVSIPDEIVSNPHYKEMQSQGLLRNQLMNYYVLKRPGSIMHNVSSEPTLESTTMLTAPGPTPGGLSNEATLNALQQGQTEDTEDAQGEGTVGDPVGGGRDVVGALKKIGPMGEGKGAPGGDEKRGSVGGASDGTLGGSGHGASPISSSAPHPMATPMPSINPSAMASGSPTRISSQARMHQNAIDLTSML